jgi:hypothetical protein
VEPGLKVFRYAAWRSAIGVVGLILLCVDHQEPLLWVKEGVGRLPTRASVIKKRQQGPEIAPE